jgi:hypothetical protein
MAAERLARNTRSLEDFRFTPVTPLEEAQRKQLDKDKRTTKKLLPTKRVAERQHILHTQAIVNAFEGWDFELILFVFTLLAIQLIFFSFTQ